ncbi:MAG: serine acetyltransferase [Planctomycetes bacterium GWF2_40_8]|nr:MAG: serine acetyltransferase [Planctomycetes bacterium GWF2_40_8]
MQKIIILGGGGHAKVLIDLIRTLNQYEIAGILDLQQLKVDTHILGIPVLGEDDLLPQLYKEGIKNVCIGVGSTKDNSRRKMLYEKVKHTGFSIPFLIHPRSVVSENLRFSEGIQVMAGAIVQTDSIIGENTIINTGSIVEHDCIIGKHVHICPGVVISGGCTVGDSTFIGAGATVIQGIKIGNNTIVAAGAVVINNVPDGTVVKGVPARV